MDIELFNFELPEELIAQTPLQKRDHSRLLVLDKDKNTICDKYFYDIVDYLKKDDVLVRNNTKVIPARLFGEKKETHAHVEVLILKQIEGDTYECLCGNAKVIKEGSVISFGNDLLQAKCIMVKEEGIRILRFIYKGIFLEVLDKLGQTPLPPYIKKQLKDKNRYQTVYAKNPGSAAAPTAGFHFTDDLFKKIKEKGVRVVDITLHIGLGTFRPVKVKNTEEHIMHSEYYEISDETADVLNDAKRNHHRIIAVGTTSCRSLEANISKYGYFKNTQESTDIFITPGYTFKAIDGLITNFHLPKSTLAMLVSAFAGREFILNSYKHAIEKKYRFFSFGDSMLII